MQHVFKKSLFLLFFFQIITPVLAKEKITEQKVLTISSNFTKKSYSLILRLNEQFNVIGVKTKDNLSGRIKSYPASYLKKKIILARALGIELITLECLNFKINDGCKIIITYPYNIGVGDFDQFKSYMSKNKSKWSFFKSGKKFKQIYLHANKFLGLLIGFNKIDFN